MTYRVDVRGINETRWASNGLRFDTKGEAEDYAHDLYRRWMGMDAARVDGLKQDWFGADWFPSVYVNPPYGKARAPWVRECGAAGLRGQRVILLVPAATDTALFQETMATADWVCFIAGRVRFGVVRRNRREEAASHPSALIGWNVRGGPCARLGRLMENVRV